MSLSNVKAVAKYQASHPWVRFLGHARTRCNNPRRDHWHRYGGRGIRCLLTLDEAKRLWFRDSAWTLTKPSLDRKDNDGNYEFDNCRFIEFDLNSLPNRSRKANCRKGHPYAPENVYTYPNGGRSCITCRRTACLKRKHGATNAMF